MISNIENIINKIPVNLRIVMVIWTISLLLIYTWSKKSISGYSENIILEHARSQVDLILVTRFWNSVHGGIYVPVTDKTPPNKYLDVPNRDITTSDNKKLTLMNPSYMNRQISEIAKMQNTATFRLFSINPLRPENKANNIEKDNYKKFIKGKKEILTLLNINDKQVYNYMRPIRLERTCIKCHKDSLAGSIHGGISINLPAESFMNYIKNEQRQMLILLFIIYILGIAIILFIRTRVKRKIEFTRKINDAKNHAVLANRLKTEFLANMSHEIRTPMNAVLGSAELLSETKLAPNQTKYINTVLKSGEKVLRLINDILDLSKVEAGLLELDIVNFNLKLLVEGVVDILSIMANEKDLLLTYHIDSDVPLNLNGDIMRLEQILINLINNAIKFTVKGEVKLIIKKVNQDKMLSDSEKSLEKSNIENEMMYLMFSVIDTGIGIPEDKLHYIFNSFYQVEGARTKTRSGTGLGLTISKKLVNLMGGKIWTERNQDVGSTFNLIIPFNFSEDNIIHTIKPEIFGSSFRVLLLNDLKNTKFKGNSILEQLGISVNIIENDESSIAEFKKAQKSTNPYNLIFWKIGTDVSDLSERIKVFKTVFNDKIVAILPSKIKQEVVEYLNSAQVKYLNEPLIPSEIVRVFNEIRSETNKSTKKIPVNSEVEKQKKNNQLKILLIEDNEENRMIVKAFLKKTDYIIKSANDGQIGLDMFIKNKYNLVLMDMQMPIMDGYSCTCEIRKWENENKKLETPIIALTAYALKEEVKKCFDAGCNAYLGKPFKKTDLLKLIIKIT